MMTQLAELTPSLRIVGQRAILRLLDFPLAGHDMLPVAAGPGCWLKPHPPRCTVNNLGPNSLLGPIACLLPARWPSDGKSISDSKIWEIDG
jgi:hypothetical protein